MSKKIWSEVFVTAFLFWMPIDLLYLYYTGGWWEPIRVIEISEIILLYLMPVFAIVRYVLILKDARRNV